MLQPNPGSARTEPANGERVISAALCACLRQTADGWLTVHRPSPHDTDFIRATARTGRRAQPSRVIRLTPHRQLEPRQLASARSGPNPTTQNIRSCTRERPSQLPGLARSLGGSAACWKGGCITLRHSCAAPAATFSAPNTRSTRPPGPRFAELSTGHAVHEDDPDSRPWTADSSAHREPGSGICPRPWHTATAPWTPWLAAGHQPQPVCRYGAAEGLRAFHS